jgi:hypothetical protein
MHFGKNVDDAFGHLRYLSFYTAGFVATMTQPRSHCSSAVSI